ncbi:hypothetical protein V5O48_010422 [Marasmius crinis-equi]|uniref:Xylanolytic transcriptional activator regulatory domain-containing protein n=1 Tax=Marasmius crinis-equi TaxID=585013 RepID=A0ABR3F8I5_9AGAR
MQEGSQYDNSASGPQNNNADSGQQNNNADSGQQNNCTGSEQNNNIGSGQQIVSHGGNYNQTNHQSQVHNHVRLTQIVFIDSAQPPTERSTETLRTPAQLTLDEIYVHHLFGVKNNFHPLPKPCPSRNTKGRYVNPSGIRIGDVGVFKYHAPFKTLFNLNNSNIPGDVESLPKLVTHVDTTAQTELIVRPTSGIKPPQSTKRGSRTVQQFSLNSPSGALLLLPRGSSLRSLAGPKAMLEECMRRNYPKWLALAEQHEAQDFDSRTLCVVTDVVKCTAWAIAVWDEVSLKGPKVMKLKLTEDKGCYAWDISAPNCGVSCSPETIPSTRQGRSQGRRSQPYASRPPCNQDVFVRGYWITGEDTKVSTKPPHPPSDPRLRAQYSDSGYSSPVDVGSTSIGENPPGSQSRDPAGGHAPTNHDAHRNADTSHFGGPRQDPNPNRDSMHQSTGANGGELHMVAVARDRLPVSGSIRNPCEAINKFILALLRIIESETGELGVTPKCAISHDDDWVDIVELNTREETSYPDYFSFIRRVSSKVKFVVDKDVIYTSDLLDTEKGLIDRYWNDPRLKDSVPIYLEFRCSHGWAAALPHPRSSCGSPRAVSATGIDAEPLMSGEDQRVDAGADVPDSGFPIREERRQHHAETGVIDPNSSMRDGEGGVNAGSDVLVPELPVEYCKADISNDVRLSSQNYPQVRANGCQDGQTFSPDIPRVTRSSRALSHGHPLSWSSDETTNLNLTLNSTTQSPSTLLSSLSHGHQQQPQNSNQPNNTAVSTHRASVSSSTSWNAGKRKCGARRSPVDSLTEQHTTYKRSRDRDSDSDDSDDDDDLDISFGMSRLTGASSTISGRRGKAARLTHKSLQEQIRCKDTIIASLLRQRYNPYIVGGKVLELNGTAKGTEEGNSDTEGITTHAQRYGLVETDGGSMDTEHDTNHSDHNDAENTRRLYSSLPYSRVPLGLIANPSPSDSSKKGVPDKKDSGGAGASKKKDLLDEAGLGDGDAEVANKTYSMPGPANELDIRTTFIDQHSPPEILVHGLVTPGDVVCLFDIFYTRVNPFVCMLDPVIHTPSLVYARCPTLFAVICAVSSRYYAEKSEIYPTAMHFAKHSAAIALVDGWKSVELCQAYFLMSIYAVPARRSEEDPSWLYTGLAIRIAADLNLHMSPTTKPHNEKQEREMLNRTRVWMMCFNLDRSTAIQSGKPSTIKEDYIVRNSDDWYKKSQYNLDYDVHLCAYTALPKIVARFQEEIFSDPSTPSGLNMGADFRTITLKHDEYLIQFEEQWSQRFKEQLKPDDPGASMRCNLLPFLVAYSRLVMFSFGFQQAFQRGLRSGDEIFLQKCLESAKGVITCMVDSLAPSGYMRYAPDGYFVNASYASGFLLTLLTPQCSSLLSREERSEIYQLIGRLIQTLSSPTLAIDYRHAPMLHARFLAGFLSHYCRDGATVDRLQLQPPPQQQSGSREYETQPPAPPPSSLASMSTFSVSPSTQTGTGSGLGYGAETYSNGTEIVATSTPTFHAEATYTAGAGPVQFDVDSTSMESEDKGMSDGPEMLATMLEVN